MHLNKTLKSSNAQSSLILLNAWRMSPPDHLNQTTWTRRNGALLDRPRRHNSRARATMALFEPDRFGAASRRYHRQAGQFYILFSAHNVSGDQRSVQLDSLASEPLSSRTARLHLMGPRRPSPQDAIGVVSRRRAGMLAISTAAMPVRKMPSKVPAPPIEAIGALSSPNLPKFMRSAPINVPREPAM